MPNGSRTSDAVSHGGAIATGSPNVITEGLPTARLSDLVACALHGAAAIGGSSSSVLVNGRGFARIGDGCICGSGGSVGPGSQDVLLFLLQAQESGKTLEELMRESPVVAMHLEGLLQDTNNDGVRDSISINGTLLRVNLEGDWGNFRMDVLSLEAQSAFREGPAGFSVTNRAEVHGASIEGQYNIDPNTSVRAEGGALNASATQELLIGDDGDRVGGAVEYGAKASVLSGEVGGSHTSSAGELLARPLGPLGSLLVRGVSSLSPSARRALETPVTIDASVGGSLISVGADGKAAAYYDRSSGQGVFEIGGDIAALLGIGFDLKVTVGEDQSESRQAPASGDATGGAGPNLIAAGAGSVIVGG